MLASTIPLAATARSSRSISRRLYNAHPYGYTCRRCLSTCKPFAASRRTTDFNSGFTGTYDPTVDSGRGPMFNKNNFGVPQFYPRDLKKRVDDYVVGQERAKKTICSTIFNHYQNIRRRHQHEQEDREIEEKITRQRYARERELYQRRRETNPAEGLLSTDSLL